MRFVIRLFLLAYLVLPVVAGFLLIQTFAQIRDTVTPIFQTASTNISSATATLNQELTSLGSNFAPLAAAVNAARSALQQVLNFIQGTIYTLIDVVNSLNATCSVANVGCIPKSINMTLPSVVNLTFLNNISTSVSTISTEVNTVVNTTTTAINSYTTMLNLIIVLFVGWIVLTYILVFIALYKGLWQRF
jgi:methyl-accepting chemotaxis protein